MFRKLIATALAAVSLVSLSSCSDGGIFTLPSAGDVANKAKDVDIFGDWGNFGKGGLSANNADIDFALKTIEYLEVRDYQDKGTYNRSYFGAAWTDNNTAEGGGNGCDTRNDILKRDLADVRYAPSDTKKCVVITGTLENDPYTGRPINFRRGTSTSSAVQIDHIVPLKNAWVMGADTWTDVERVRFANDPKNLLAVDGPANNGKSDKAADTWVVPDNPAFRCDYIALQVEIKSDYQLAVSPREKSAMVNVLNQCAKSS